MHQRGATDQNKPNDTIAAKEKPTGLAFAKHILELTRAALLLALVTLFVVAAVALFRSPNPSSTETSKTGGAVSNPSPANPAVPAAVVQPTPSNHTNAKPGASSISPTAVGTQQPDEFSLDSARKAAEAAVIGQLPSSEIVSSNARWQSSDIRMLERQNLETAAWSEADVIVIVETHLHAMPLFIVVGCKRSNIPGVWATSILQTSATPHSS